MHIVQTSFLPDNEQPEPTVKRPSVPVAKLIDGHWCWLVFGSDGVYRHEPELEALLLVALFAQDGAERRAA